MAGSLSGSLLSSVTTFLPYYNQLSVYATAEYNKLWPTNPPDVSTVMSAYSKFPDNTIEWKTMMKVLGYGDNAQKWYKEAITTVLPFSAAVTANDRGILPTNTKYSLDYIRRQNNIPKELADTFVKLNKWYPSLSDLNLWFIRNVYDDKVVKRYNLDAYIQDITIPGMGKGYDIYKHLGLNDTFAKLEWYATWRMPSFYQATYMYNWYLGNKDDMKETQSGKIHFDENDFKYAMRVANWPPIFQNLLTKITSHPPTRIMIEQFYQSGLIKEKDLPKWFDWSGYHGKINEMLVKYTLAARAPTHKKGLKHATASLLQKLYINGKINLKDYETHMKTLGYTDGAIKLYEAYIALDEQLQYEKVAIQYLREAYLKNEIDDTSALSTMKKVGVADNIANEYLLKWKTTKIRSRRYLSVTDLDKMYVNKILTGNEVLDYLRELGYTSIDAERLMKLKGIKQ